MVVLNPINKSRSIQIATEVTISILKNENLIVLKNNLPIPKNTIFK